VEHTNTNERHQQQEMSAGSNAQLLSPQQGPRVCFINARQQLTAVNPVILLSVEVVVVCLKIRVFLCFV